MMILLYLTAVLVSGTFTVAQEENIQNFKVASQTNTHITISWDVVDGYYSSSNINKFDLRYQSHSEYTSSTPISYSSTTQNTNTNGVVTFISTISTESYSHGEYVMWIRVTRSSLEPRYTYSGKQFVNIGAVQVVLEFKVHLWPYQTCSDFALQETTLQYRYRYYGFGWARTIQPMTMILLKGCQCTLPHDFSMKDGYYTCASNYVIYRGILSTQRSLHLPSLKANLTNFLTRPDRKARITLDGIGYLVSPGPCGVTVPHLDSPHCFNEAPDSEHAPTVHAAISISSTPQDNTTIIAIVSSMCGAVLILFLTGCAVFLVKRVRKNNRKPTSTAEVNTTHDLEMAAEGLTRNIQLPSGGGPVYANTEVSIQPNPSYVYRIVN